MLHKSTSGYVSNPRKPSINKKNAHWQSLEINDLKCPLRNIKGCYVNYLGNNKSRVAEVKKKQSCKMFNDNAVMALNTDLQHHIEMKITWFPSPPNSHR